ncbi:MAG: ParB/RepB/Spo0J family partition protein [Pseudomonadota bacterium]
MVKTRGLGRGLDALLGGNDKAASVEETQASMAIKDLQPGKFQPRTQINQQGLQELAESIKTQGVMQPILVRPIADGRHEIVAGERRWRAARIAGLTSVPVLVRDIPDRQALAAALIENIQREDLNPLEEATGIARLTQEFGLTHAATAEVLGKSRTAVTNLLRLLELAPPVRELLAQGKLDMGHARALLALPATRQIELAREAAARQWSVREVESRVSGAGRKPVARARRAVDRDVLRLQEDLAQKLGTNVIIKPRGKGGALVIDYASLDALDDLISRLTR